MEMIEDILREMSGLAKEIRGNSISNAYELLMGYADRIEAAVKHQFRDVTKMILKEVAVAKMETTTPTCEKSSQVGNAAKMYEALKTISKCDISKEEDCYTLYRICEAALSAPPRNCDRFANEDEAQKAFIVWYNTVYDLSGVDEVSSCDLKHNVDGILHDYIKWLFDKAKGE